MINGYQPKDYSKKPNPPSTGSRVGGGTVSEQSRVTQKECLVKAFDKAFGISSIASPVGSCKDDFLLDRAITLITNSNLETKDKDALVRLFKENMFHSPRGWDNGRGAGRKYVGVINAYFKSE